MLGGCLAFVTVLVHKFALFRVEIIECEPRNLPAHRATCPLPEPRSEESHWLHQVIFASSAGSSSSRPICQRTCPSVPLEQTHWNVNSMSPTAPVIWPTPPQ